MKKSIELWIARGKGKYSNCVQISPLQLYVDFSGLMMSVSTPADSYWVSPIDWFDYDQWPKLKPGEVRKIRMEIIK